MREVREIVTLSGKGGTGKTAVTASLAVLSGAAVLADADVDAANLGLLLGGEEVRAEDFVGGIRPVLDPDACTGCGECRRVCRFGAVGEDFRIDPVACEGCGLCSRVCPEGAIALEPRITGSVRVARSPRGTLVHARLRPGEENCGKLAGRVREIAREETRAEGLDLVLVDGPPGIGCPVMASLAGAAFLVAVTEPSASARHDLGRLLDLAEHFRVPAGVVVNKWDLEPGIAADIERSCEQRGVPALGRIPFDRSVVESVAAGVPPAEGASREVVRALREVWAAIPSPASTHPGPRLRAP